MKEWLLVCWRNGPSSLKRRRDATCNKHQTSSTHHHTCSALHPLPQHLFGRSAVNVIPSGASPALNYTFSNFHVSKCCWKVREFLSPDVSERTEPDIIHYTLNFLQLQHCRRETEQRCDIVALNIVPGVAFVPFIVPPVQILNDGLCHSWDLTKRLDTSGNQRQVSGCEVLMQRAS